jgi:integrase
MTDQPSKIVTLTDKNDTLKPLVSSETLQQLADDNALRKFNATKSDNTLKAYRRDLQCFACLIYGEQVPSNYGYRLSNEKDLWQAITYGEVNVYQIWLLRQGYAMSSINRALYAVRAYAQQAMLAGAVSAEVYQRIAAIQSVTSKAAANLDDKRPLTRREVSRQKKAEPTRIPADIIARLLNDHDLETLRGLRDSVLMGLLLELGLRASEVYDLQCAGVDLVEGRIRFYRQKVDQKQTLALPTRLQRLLRTYLDRLQQHNVIPERLVIGVTRGDLPGKPYLKPSSISNIVQQLGERYGIKKLSAHDCRHHCMTYLIQQKNANPMTIQDFGGWRDARMVRHYVRQLDVANANFAEDMYLD